MQVKVILKGEMGKLFGREWDLHVNTPVEALRLIDANVGGLFRWIRNNLNKYSAYKVLCEFPGGRKEFLDSDTLLAAFGAIKITFVPMISGAGAKAKIVLGVVLMIASIWLGPAVFSIGLSLTVGGVTQLLAPKPKANKAANTESSYYFNGAENVTDQGSPVQLIYGQCLVGSQVVSAGVTTAQLLN